MADEDNGPAVVVVGQVVLETRLQALVSRVQDGQIVGRDALGEELLQGEQGELAVHGRPYTAHSGKRGSLGNGGGNLGFLDSEIGVEGGFMAHGRVRVKAVELRRGGNRRSDQRPCPRRQHHLGLQTGRARDRRPSRAGTTRPSGSCWPRPRGGKQSCSQTVAPSWAHWARPRWVQGAGPSWGH